MENIQEKNVMKCIIWGTGTAGLKAKEMVLYYKGEIYAFCDSNKSVTKVDEYKVVLPEQMTEACVSGVVDTIIVGVEKVIYVQQMQEYIRENIPTRIKVYTVEELSGKYVSEYIADKKNSMVYHWDIDFNVQAEIWIENIMSEVLYWLEENAKPEGAYHAEYLKRLTNQKFSDMKELTDIIKPDDIVMDIGCGLVTCYGEKLENGANINLVPVDPLAHFYNKINKYYSEHGIKGYKKEVVFGLFEFIACFFPKNYADIIVINNALDHGIDPYKSIVECLYILKNGGCLHLRHMRAVAVFEQYDGLHKWNLDLNEKNELVIWNKENAINVSKELGDIADIKGFQTSEKSFVAQITKRKDFDINSFYSDRDECRMCANFLDKVMRKLSECEQLPFDERK